MIVLRNGKKVFPEEIEVLINRLEEVEESFVYGMPSKDDPNDIKIAPNGKFFIIIENFYRCIFYIWQIKQSCVDYVYSNFDT